jgi:tetratricopeptide (TPR) repeat protein
MESAQNLMAQARKLSSRGELRQALRLAAEATRSDPASAEAWFLHGIFNFRFGRLHAAADSLAEASRLKPDDTKTAIEYAGVLERLEEYDDLLAYLDAGIGRLPESTELIMSRARILSSLGDFGASREDYRAVLALRPGNVDAACALVHAGHGTDAGGLDGIKAMTEAVDRGSEDHFKLLYALARLLEQDGLIEEAFDAYATANAEQAASGGMDIHAKQRAAATVIRDLGPEIVARHEGKGHPSRRPVFIVGMPRSGTSLTEQILSRHPRVHSIGEHTFLGEVLRDLITAAPRREGALPDAIDSMGPGTWQEAGAKYLRRLDEIDDGTPRVTDKLPANFALLPWVRLLLPGARIIHVRRHPLATLASCIRTPFADTMLSFTVEDWGRFYGLYETMMVQWRPILGDSMLEVGYEDLVGDLPSQVCRMLSFLQLDLHDACLRPEWARRAVRTASREQVRHGVHTDSVEKWRRYEKRLLALQPFIRESRKAIMALVTD